MDPIDAAILGSPSKNFETYDCLIKELTLTVDDLRTRFAVNGELTEDDVPMLAHADMVLRTMTRVNVLIGHQGGLKQKRLAEAHCTNPDAIREIINKGAFYRMSWPRAKAFIEKIGAPLPKRHHGIPIELLSEDKDEWKEF